VKSLTYDSGNHHIYSIVSEPSGYYILSIDPATNSIVPVSAIPLGGQALSIAYAQITGDLYVLMLAPSSNSLEMIVVSPTTGMVLGNITGCCAQVGFNQDDPNLLYNPVNHYIYTPFDQVIDPVSARVVANIFPYTCVTACGQLDYNPHTGVVYYWTGDSGGTGVYWQTAAVYSIDPTTNQNTSYYYLQNSSVVSGLAYDFKDNIIFASLIGTGHGYSTNLTAIYTQTNSIASVNSNLPSGILSYNPSSNALYLSGWDFTNTSTESIYFIQLGVNNV